MRSIYVPLPEGAIDRLRELAHRELREPKTEAAYLILSGLRAAGLDPESSRDDAPATAKLRAAER